MAHTFGIRARELALFLLQKLEYLQGTPSGMKRTEASCAIVFSCPKYVRVSHNGTARMEQLANIL